jgi:hypothetical protein
MRWTRRRTVILEFPKPCPFDEAVRHADRLRSAGLDVYVEQWSPPGVFVFGARPLTAMALDVEPRFVLRVPKNQAARAVRGG